MEGELENPLILLTDQNLNSGQEFLPMLERIAASGNRNLFLVTGNLSDDALAMVTLNKLRGVLNTVAIKAPSYGDRMKDILGDVAVLTGARVVSEDMGIAWDNVPLQWLGTCSRVTVNKEASVIIEGAETKPTFSTAQGRFASRWSPPTATGTARSSKSGLQSCLAELA